MTTRKATNKIVIHCADTPADMDIGVDEIREWHQARDWSDIGYHLVIRRDGRIEFGRPLDQVGAHVAGHNSESVGICLVGGRGSNGQPQDNFTEEQGFSWLTTIEFLDQVYPGCEVLGHCDFPGVTKTCPNFDVREALRLSGIRK